MNDPTTQPSDPSPFRLTTVEDYLPLIGAQAVELVRTHHPDLLFLDIEMPGKNGFQVVEEIASEHLPVVVFVTAHDEYALRAFDVHALDYLVKPFTFNRFQTALTRARNEVVKSEDPTTHQRVVDRLD